ncbi:MAG: UvrD-helicase domain-containing protein [Treponema sp.]|nr:UvrD-helicase domain-containing protein [Treponema sp.]
MEYEYLDLLQKKLDPIQKSCCCAKGNSVVAAGAGSGKTQVLATRFAWLVMSKNIPAPEILTLTFTKKAAGEMYQRIYEILSYFAHHPETPAVEKKRAQQALEDFSEVHIQTLDSYCSGIVKQAANRYGIRPDFKSGSSQAAEDIKQLALPFVFSNQDNKAIKDLVKPGQYQNFANTVLGNTIENHTSLISPDNFFSEKLGLQKSILCEFWNYYICGTGMVPVQWGNFNEQLEEGAAIREVPAVYNFNTILADAQNYMENADASDKFCMNFTAAFQKITALAPDMFQPITIEDDFSNEAIQKQANNLNKIFEIWNAIKHNVGAKKQELKPFSQYVKEYFIPYISCIVQSILQYDSTKALFGLMDSFLAQVNHSKRVSGNLTFADISELALKVLTENEDIRIQEQNSFSHIMIDEFQDNNGKNRDLLFMLCGDKEKLFFVGDEKQSIYKFRGADVSVFNQLKSLPEITETEPMTYNYRSTLEMITAFNLMFGGEVSIFDNNTQEEFEAKYQKKAIKYDPVNRKTIDEPVLTDKTVPVHLELLNTNLLGEQHLNAKDQMAYYMAKTIHELLQENSDLKASDFAILEKSRTDRAYITKWLNYFNISYNQDMNKSLFSDGPVNDIYNYLRLCVYPADKNAQAAYMASPFCAMDVNQILNKLAKNRLDEIEGNTTEFHIPNQDKILSQSLCKTLEDLWIKQGYYYETILNKNTAQYASDFDMLFELARQCDLNGKSISWFVDQLSLIKDTESGFSSDDQEIDASELVYPLEKEEGVQVMSVHKSKGLQFKKVFLYGCIGMRGKTDKDNFFFDEKLGVSFTSSRGENLFYRLQKELADKKELAEIRRQIYVGVTRAIDTLYIVGSWNQKVSESSLRLFENMIFTYYPDLLEKPDVLTESLPYNPESPFSYHGIVPVTKENAYKETDSLGRKKIIDMSIVEKAFENKMPITTKECVSNRKTPSSLELEYNPKTSEDGDTGAKYEESSDVLTNSNFTAADFGTLVHSYLEMQANGIAPQDYVPEPKLTKGLSEAEREKTLKICIKMTEEFCNEEIGKRFTAAKKAGLFYKAEWAFRMFHEETIFTGSIDLIFQNPDGTYTIVDYKSDNEINVEKYKGQQNCYRIAASKLLEIPEEKIDCVLYFLKHKALCKVFE